MEFIVLSLRSSTFTKLIDSGEVERILSRILEMEEDSFITGFHQEVQKSCEQEKL